MDNIIEHEINATVVVSADQEMVQVLETANKFSQDATVFKVADITQYSNSGVFLQKIKKTSSELDQKRKELTKPLDECKKKIMDYFRDPIESLITAERTVKTALLAYKQEQDRLQREAEQKALAAAKAVAEAEQERLLEEAKKKVDEGRVQKAEEILEKAVQVQASPVVRVPSFQSTQPVAGLSTRKIWKCRITDESQLPREYLIPNKPILDKMATSTKGEIKIPGVEFYSEEIMSSRRG